LQHDPKLQQKLRWLTSPAAMFAIVSAGLLLFAIKPAFAEFQIQEAGIEKGEVELEYRGAYHWGVPQVTDTNENANDVVQSHEIELQMGINDWFLIQVTSGFQQPLGDNLQASEVEIEAEIALLKRQGDGIALSFQAGYEQAINHGAQVDGDPNQFGFGPIVELAKGPFLLTLNPLFTKQIGTFADQEGLGFDYGWRGEYDFTKHWGIGVEMFCEIEDLAKAGPFNSQVHSLGPTLFYNFGGDEDEATGGNDDPKAKASGEEQAIEPVAMAFSMNVGVQFGLTDATSDTALKFQGSISF
jgi:hypothetical protein